MLERYLHLFNDFHKVELRDIWEATSFALEKRQREPACVDMEQKRLRHRSGPSYKMSYSVTDSLSDTLLGERPRVAILRQEGSNGMAVLFINSPPS